MEEIKQVALRMQNLQPLQQNISQSQTDSITIYKGNLTTQGWVAGIKKLKSAFPLLAPAFHDILAERIKANGFTDERFIDAVENVIDTCKYSNPTIADFISFDKRFKVYTYSQYCKLCDEGDGKNYQPVSINGNEKPVWAHINDIKQFNLPLWKK